MKTLIIKATLLATALLLTVTFLQAQNYQWHKQFTGNLPNSSLGNDVAVDALGNVYVVGKFQGTIDFGLTSLISTGIDFFFAKYNASGTLQWVKNIGALNADVSGTGVSLHTSGSTIFLYVTGHFTSTNGQLITVDFNPGPGGELTMNDLQGDAFIAKFNASNGSYVWAKRINNTIANSFYKQKVATDASGNAYVTADVDSNNQGTLRKFDINGNALWTKTTTGVMRDVACRGTHVYVGGALLGSNSNAGVAWFNASNGSLISSAGVGRDVISFSLDTGNGIYLLAHSSQANTTSLEKFNTSNNLVWSTAIDLNFLSYGFHDISIGGSNQSEVLVGGWFAGMVNFGNGFTLTAEGSNNNLFAARHNASNGSCMWVKNNPVSSVGGGGGWNTTAIASNAQNFYILSFVNNATIDIDYCTPSINLNATNANNGYVAKYLIESTLSTAIISGPTTVCTTGGTYTLTNVPAGASVSWVASPANLFVSSFGSGTTAIIQANSGVLGSANLTFTINSTCGLQYTPVSIEFWVGNPPPAHYALVYVPGFYGQNPIMLAEDALYTFTIEPVDVAVSYEWVLPEGFSFMSNQNTSFETVNVWTGNQSGTFVLKCYPQGVCGTNGYSSLYIQIPGSGGGGSGIPGCEEPPCLVPQPLKIFPNPAKGQLTILLQQAQSNLPGNDETEITLYNKMLQNVFVTSVTSKEVVIQTTNLPNDIYFLSIRNNQGVIMRQIRIEN
jgi:hypothetical protein